MEFKNPDEKRENNKETDYVYSSSVGIQLRIELDLKVLYSIDKP
jgi:hypothetical protein